MTSVPLNGHRLLNHLEGSLRQSPVIALAQALEGIEQSDDDAVDGTNGAVKSEPVSRAVDPSRGRGKAQDPLLESLIATVGRRSIF